MIEQPSRTLVCSIVFLDIVEYSTKPVAEQLLLKQAFNKLLSASLENVPARDRVVLDTGDGAGITFLGDPEDALFVAMSLRAAARAEATGAIAIRIGINLGPVRLVKDINGQMNIIGDGINVAQRIMSFAQSGQLLVPRSFYEVVSCLSLDYASLFSYVGARTDKHVREHEVYSVGIGTDAARRVLETGSLRVAPHSAAPRLIGQLTDARPFGVHRMALVGAPLVFALMVASGVAVRAQVKPEAAPVPAAAVRPAAKPAPVAKAEPAAKIPAAAAAPKATAAKADAPSTEPRATQAPQPSTPATAPVAKAAPSPRTTAPKPVAKPVRMEVAAAKPEPAAPPAAPTPALAAGVIQLSILPWGEVFVDGKSRGVSPPLRNLELPPGAHTIEVRNTTFPVHSQRIEVRSGEPVRIRHQFR
ncbi:MAG TPA: adenylate/guanylate cyclase domain-containing protein [Burkholderiales bacterium]|nr:adenylate/guanylate cyclase domain-containing protein [Burkholderiales bacterium]